MRKLLLLMGLLLSLASCVNTKEKVEPSAVELKKNIEYLASDELNGRRTGTKGEEMAAEFLIKELKAYGVKPYFENYKDKFSLDGENGTNVVGYIPGSGDQLKKEFVVLGAHYDHIGVVPEKAVDGDSIANGANDDASGVVSVLEIARNLAESNPKRSVLIAFFSGEEQGLLGSKHLAKRLSDRKDFDLYAMLNFEMLGVPLKNREYSAYLTGFNKSNLADRFNEYAGENVLGYFDRAASMNLFKRSDNYPFFQEFKAPAQTLCTFDFSNFEYYHHVDDEVEEVDIKHMQSLVKKSLHAIKILLNDPKSRIKIKSDSLK